ncbi:hypothetical protein P4T12_03345, partial [Aeribacillus composti]|nr:hypothetical protein [Aeribacillus composti]
FRKESRWGFYHYYLDYPERDDQNWLKRVIVKKGADGKMKLYTRDLPPQILDDSGFTQAYYDLFKKEETGHEQSVS